MQTTIVARVAEYLRDPEARKRVDKSAGQGGPQIRDQIFLSDEGKRKSDELGKTSSEWEKDRMERVSVVTERVQTQNYKMAPEVVDQIARRIVAFL